MFKTEKEAKAHSNKRIFVLFWLDKYIDWIIYPIAFLIVFIRTNDVRISLLSTLLGLFMFMFIRYSLRKDQTMIMVYGFLIVFLTILLKR